MQPDQLLQSIFPELSKWKPISSVDENFVSFQSPDQQTTIGLTMSSQALILELIKTDPEKEIDHLDKIVATWDNQRATPQLSTTTPNKILVSKRGGIETTMYVAGRDEHIPNPLELIRNSL